MICALCAGEFAAVSPAQMFRIASGDPWPASLPILDENGSIDYNTCLYMCSFIIIVCWVRLCACMQS